MIRVALVEDNDTIRLGLAALIDGTPGFQCAGAWGSCEDMLAELREIWPDVLLMDFGLPGMSGIEGLVEPKASPVVQEETLLTSRERDILNGLAGGNSYQALAKGLNISTDTVRFHIRNIYRKLHVHSQSEAVAKALRKGII